MTYLTLNLIFIAVVLITLRLLSVPIAKKWYIVLLPLLILTAVFDPILIHLDVFDYADNKILGIRFFGAPVEDFIYSLLAALLVPTVWEAIQQRRRAR